MFKMPIRVDELLTKLFQIGYRAVCASYNQQQI